MKVQIVVLLGLLLLAGAFGKKHIEMDDNDNENDNEKFDYDQPRSLEDEDEDEDKAQAVADKMFGHLSQLKEAIQSSEMSLGERSAALDNLSHIERDAQAMRRSESEVHKNHLQEAMKLRMQALKMQLHSTENNNNDNDDDNDNEDQPALEADNEDNNKETVAQNNDNDDDEEENNNGKAMEEDNKSAKNAENDGDDDNDNDNEEENDSRKLEEEKTAKIATKVSHDIEAVESQLSSLHNTKISALARQNLEAIRKDASRFASSHDQPELRSRLSEAMQLRVAALKLMLKDSPKSSEADRVKQDMKNLEEKVLASSMPKTKKHEAMSNLKAMLHDAEEISNGVSESRNNQLKRALKLRMRALKQQLE